MRKIHLAWLALTFALGSGVSVAAGEPERIVQVAATDPEMNAAKERGRASLPEFFRHLEAPGADESQFMVKFDIVAGEEAEFVWATELERSGGRMTGVLVNQPEYTDHRLGDRVNIAEADIIDWAYFRGAVMQGAFTNRVLLDRLPPEEAEQLRRAYGW